MRKIILSAAFVFAATAALAQSPDMVRVRGTIQSVDGSIDRKSTRLNSSH